MYSQEMMDSIKHVEATRQERITAELRRMTADEKEQLLKQYHPDFVEDGFQELKAGPNRGDKVPHELADLLQAGSRLAQMKGPAWLDAFEAEPTVPDYETDVLVIGGGGAGACAAIEANEAKADVMIVTKLRMGDANTMMVKEGSRQPTRSMTPLPSTTLMLSGAAITPISLNC